MKAFLFALFGFVMLGVLGTPGVAHAGKPKVAVLPIDGDGGNEVEKALASSLGDDFSVGSHKETVKAIKSIGGLDDDSTDKDYAKLAESMGADVVVAGRLDAKDKGDKQSLHIRLYVKGKKSKKFAVQFGNPSSDKFKKTMAKTLVDKIGTINKSGDDEDKDADADDKPAPKAEKKPKPKKVEKKEEADEEAATKPLKKAKKQTEDDVDDDKPAPAKKKKAAKAEDDDGATPAASDDDDAPKPKKARKKKTDDSETIEGTESEDGALHLSPHAANRDAVRVDFGVGVANRSLIFNSRQFTDGIGAPHPYRNAPVPAGHLTAELFPFAFQSPRSPAAGFGVWGDFDKTISLTLQSYQPATMQTVRAKATQQRWSVGGGYRFAFTKSDLSPTVTVGINYARQSFKVDRAQSGAMDIDLPDVDYKMWQPLLALRIPFAANVALVANGRGMLITDAGAITTIAEYGQASVFGFQAEAGLDITFSGRFALRAEGFFSQVGYTFTKGVGEKANDRDGDPSTKDIFGAADRMLGGSLTLGVLY